jgi:hypothetical protein
MSAPVAVDPVPVAAAPVAAVAPAAAPAVAAAPVPVVPFQSASLYVGDLHNEVTEVSDSIWNITVGCSWMRKTRN